MIAIVSSSPREARALAALAGHQPRPVYICQSVRQFESLLRKTSPTVVVTRASLADGYSDDVLSLLAASGNPSGTRAIVLAPADLTSRQEARQVALGADCVLKDPLRTEVLLQYVVKFLGSPPGPAAPKATQGDFTLAGATILADRNQLRHGNRLLHVTPKEVELARLLAESPGRTLSYPTLYSELFCRAFAGETANARVLLGKLTASYRKIRIDLRSKIEVIPKSGYRYSPDGK